MTRGSQSRLDRNHLLSLLEDFGVRLSRRSLPGSSAETVVEVDSDSSLAVLTVLRDDESTSMRRLVDLTAIDRLGLRDADGSRFVVVYQLHSPTLRHRLRVEVVLGSEFPNDSPDSMDGESEGPTIDSVTALWPAANWLECEVFDLFGIRFRSHPELRRILLDLDFKGSPLRKDHPLKTSSSTRGEDIS
jgi:NADH-quinone oxidoreductase subunit C